jgi:hypothetical protein
MEKGEKRQVAVYFLITTLALVGISVLVVWQTGKSWGWVLGTSAGFGALAIMDHMRKRGK